MTLDQFRTVGLRILEYMQERGGVIDTGSIDCVETLGLKTNLFACGLKYLIGRRLIVPVIDNGMISLHGSQQRILSIPTMFKVNPRPPLRSVKSRVSKTRRRKRIVTREPDSHGDVEKPQIQDDAGSSPVVELPLCNCVSEISGLRLELAAAQSRNHELTEAVRRLRVAMRYAQLEPDVTALVQYYLLP